MNGVRHSRNWIARLSDGSEFLGMSELREATSQLTGGGDRRSATPAYYRWKLLDNPSGRGVAAVALDDNGAVVGSATVTAKPLVIQGQRVSGAEIGDTFTRLDFRRRGIFPQLVTLARDTMLASGCSFIYGTPNSASLPGYERALDFQRIPSVGLFGLGRPVHAGAVLAARSRWGRAIRLLGPAVELGYGLFYRPPAQPKDVHLTWEKAVPAGVDELFERSAGGYDWIVERSHSYLEWRFVTNPDTYDFVVARNRGRLEGFVVTKSARWGPLRVVYLADFLAPVEACFAALVSEVIRRSQDADLVVAWAARRTLYFRVLRRAGFMRYSDYPVICAGTRLGRQARTSDWRFHFTMADSDNI